MLTFLHLMNYKQLRILFDCPFNKIHLPFSATNKLNNLFGWHHLLDFLVLHQHKQLILILKFHQDTETLMKYLIVLDEI